MRKFIDLHQDLLLHMEKPEMYPDPRHIQTNPPLLEKANFKVLVASVFPVTAEADHLSSENNNIISEEIDKYKSLANDCKWGLIKTSADLRGVVEGRGKGLLLHIEGLNAISNENFDLLDLWYEKGVRSLGIVWNLKNNLGGGAKEKGGLTALGAEVVRWADRRGVLFDFAHMNEETFWEASKLWKKPIIVTHGNCKAVAPSVRNYTDDQLEVVAVSGGLVGIFFPNTFLKKESEEVGIEDVVAHIRHVRDVVGVDHVAIGSDFGGILSSLPEGLESVDKIVNLWQGLERAGFTDEEIKKIAWKNAYRALEEVLT